MTYKSNPGGICKRGGARGFSLVEVLVAVVVICVGLLGIAKMQALAVSNTNIARQRSMAAFLAAGLASTMHSNRAFWASAAAAADAPVGTPLTINSVTQTVTPAALTAGVTNQTCIGTLASGPKCPESAGTPGQTLAAFDIVRWSSSVGNLLPNAITYITCPGNVQPPSCTIEMTWTEQAVMTNSTAYNTTGTGQVNAPGVGFQNPTYFLDVEP